MLREETVFGPIRSRRLGVSLGINLLPTEGKVCNFDCVYCECGWNKDGQNDRRLPTLEDVETALRSKLEQMNREGEKADSITFSGDGEPTLNLQFSQIIDMTLRLRDELMPEAKVSVLTNATRVGVREIADALRKVDNPILKIDASTDDGVRRINHPVGSYSLDAVVEALRKFDGNFILQTMFLRSRDFDSFEENNLKGWINIVRRIHPRQVMVYTIDRPTPDCNLRKASVEEMQQAVKPLVDEGFDVVVRG